MWSYRSWVFFAVLSRRWHGDAPHFPGHSQETCMRGERAEGDCANASCQSFFSSGHSGKMFIYLRACKPRTLARAQRQSSPVRTRCASHARDTQLTARCHSSVTNAAHISKLSGAFSDSETASRGRCGRAQPAHRMQKMLHRAISDLQCVSTVYSKTEWTGQKTRKAEVHLEINVSMMPVLIWSILAIQANQIHTPKRGSCS